ncbi:hypothetical protein MAC_01239 [Metarhizium acridum CQMa 102]|uniref:Uncharacterized protein n=1 Tax=Metarhizium acridum (strain CQMa 102) TaxID=655827 RepID=E9DUE1_METAQ|nr:uncharacterized protein MAC_01239 [Metarhizium acridum CQMa 102]EFY92603.1 hypothetical protein MAC_01239 [Metarhizium acridum CQMa 102]
MTGCAKKSFGPPESLPELAKGSREPGAEEPLAATIRDAHRFLRWESLYMGSRYGAGGSTASSSRAEELSPSVPMTPPLHRGFGHWPRSKLSPRPVRDCACGLLLGCWKQTCGGLFLDSEDLGSRSEASESRTLQSYYIEHTKTVRSVAFGKARKLLATGADDKVKDVSSIWDVEKEANGDIHATTSDYSGVEGGTKDTSEVAAIDDGTVRVWELDIEELGNEIGEPLDARRGDINSVAFASHYNGYLLASCTERAIDV